MNLNPETVLAILPNSKEDAISMDEIALALGLDISSYIATGRTKRQLLNTATYGGDVRSL